MKIGLVKSYRLLGDLDDPLGLYCRQTESWLLNALSKRNGSLLAHGLTPVGPEIWKEVGDRWIQWLTEGMGIAGAGGRSSDKLNH